MTKNIFLWDIDGTLLLSGGAGAIAFERTFEELYNEKYIWQKIQPDGKTDPAIIDQLFAQRFNRHPTQEESAKIIGLYHRFMEEELPRSPKFRLMPHVVETLTDLAADPQNLLGLATGNFEPAAWMKLKRGKLDRFFSFGGFGSDAADRAELTRMAFERGKKHLTSEPLRTYVIGDTIYDIRCGKKIGATTVAVCTGSTPRNVLEAEGADVVLDDLRDFLDIL